MKPSCALTVVLCMLFAVSCAPSAEEPDVFDKILSSSAVKLEWCDESEAIFIDNDLIPIQDLASLAILPASDDSQSSSSETAEDTPEDWIYRFTYDPPEKIINGEDTVMVFTDENVIINGTVFEPEEGVSYEDILELAKIKYEYYSGENADA